MRISLIKVMKMEEVKNGEILLLYEAKNCNPNGDPDHDNRPRIDQATGINYVTDVRLKRFIRDYISNQYGEDYVFVNLHEGRHVTSDDRAKCFGIKTAEDAANKFFDVRLFGVLIPERSETTKESSEKGGEKKGQEKKVKSVGSIALTGPVQFAWGYSLHPVEIIDFPRITSIFQGRAASETVAEAGTMGLDWRVYYSLIAFYGVISGKRAKVAHLENRDLMAFDNLLIQALALEPTTRSKIPEKLLLYLRIEYSQEGFLIGDLRDFINVTSKQQIRKFTDLEIDFSPLLRVLTENKDKIKAIYLYQARFNKLEQELQKHFPEKLKRLPHPLSQEELKQIVLRK